MEGVKRLWAWLTGFGADKYMHFICGGAVVGIVALWGLVAPYAWLFGVVAGLVKEVVDYCRCKVFDLLDWTATALGALAVQGFVWLYLVMW